jgi:hypothetical protein
LFSDRIHRLPVLAALHRGDQNTFDVGPDAVLPVKGDARRAPFSINVLVRDPVFDNDAPRYVRVPAAACQAALNTRLTPFRQ